MHGKLMCYLTLRSLMRPMIEGNSHVREGVFGYGFGGFVVTDTGSIT